MIYKYRSTSSSTPPPPSSSSSFSSSPPPSSSLPYPYSYLCLHSRHFHFHCHFHVYPALGKNRHSIQTRYLRIYRHQLSSQRETRDHGSLDSSLAHWVPGSDLTQDSKLQLVQFSFLHNAHRILQHTRVIARGRRVGSSNRNHTYRLWVWM